MRFPFVGLAPMCAASTASLSTASGPAAPGPRPLLVTDLSGQGQLVRLVLSDLLSAHRVPPADLVAVTRAPEKVAQFQQRGVRVVTADFESIDSVRQAFKCTILFLRLIYYSKFTMDYYIVHVQCCTIGECSRTRFRF